MSTLSSLESRLQTLLEFHLLKLLPGYHVEDGMLHQLASAMKNNLMEKEGSILAPNVFVIVTHPADESKLTKDSRFFKEMAAALEIAGQEEGYSFFSSPVISTAVDEKLKPGEFRVLASLVNNDMAETRQVVISEASSDSNPDKTTPAFFIIGGKKTVPISSSVVNVGRRIDNHIVIDDPRVSRNHVQIRALDNGYYLFDLNSKGGTTVNGKRVNKVRLHPGDIISLAGVTLIFGQDSSEQNNPNVSETEPQKPG
jgi:pSer/pThr/pTyr-binding forkhead associated (FHA) protein